jgi:hypothetical protein
MNTEIMQQQAVEKPIWERLFDSMFNPEDNGGGLLDNLTRTFDDLVNQTERAASNPVDSGLFAASNVQESFYESMKSGISNGPIGVLSELFGFGGSTATNTAASAGNSLYYNNQSEYQDATTQGNASGGTTNNYVNQARRVRGLPVKGGVSSNLLANSGDVEDYILQRQLLDQPSGGSGGMAAAILERIAEAVESGSLEEIITLLTAIRDKNSEVVINTSGGGGGGSVDESPSALKDVYDRAWLNGNWTHVVEPSYSNNANILGTYR